MSNYSKRADKQKFFNELTKLRDDQRKKKGLKPASVAYKDADRKPLEELIRLAELASDEADSTIKKKSTEPLDEKKFGGLTEEEVCKRVLPDHMKPGLDIIFVSCCMHTIISYIELHVYDLNTVCTQCIQSRAL